MPAHQDVGSSTLLMIPNDSIRASSCSTLGRSGSAIWRSVKSAYGVASGLSFMTYSSPRLPRPLNTFGKFLATSVLVCEASTQAAR